MTIYNMYIFDKTCKCIYYATWHKAYLSGQQPQPQKPPSPNDATPRPTTPNPTNNDQNATTDLGWEEESKLVYGVVYSLRNMVTKLKPGVESFSCYKTNSYKLHFFEVPSGYKFVLMTDANVEAQSGVLKNVYGQIFVEYVIKNPLWRPGQTIDVELFRNHLTRYVRSLPFYA